MSFDDMLSRFHHMDVAKTREVSRWPVSLHFMPSSHSSLAILNLMNLTGLGILLKRRHLSATLRSHGSVKLHLRVNSVPPHNGLYLIDTAQKAVQYKIKVLVLRRVFADT